jgi:hypothetical protein
MNMKYFKYLTVVVLATMAGCNNFDPVAEMTEKPYVDQTSVQLYAGEKASEGQKKIQLQCSPPGKSYQWSSQDTEVVTVDQNGLLTAVNEGITTVTVASSNDRVIIDVKVINYVPLKNFTLSTYSVEGVWQDKTQVFVTYEPEDATDVQIEWSSDSTKIAEVYSNGLIKALESGETIIRAKYASNDTIIEKEVHVSVSVPLMKIDKSRWTIPGYNPNSDEGTIGYSSQQRGDGGGITTIMDNNFGSFWHARYSSPASSYPHWFIIDMNEEFTIVGVGMARRNGDGRGQTGYQVFTCTAIGATTTDPDLSDPTRWGWEDQGETSFSPGINGIQEFRLKNATRARYIKVFIDRKYIGQNEYAMVSEFDVYR